MSELATIDNQNTTVLNVTTSVKGGSFEERASIFNAMNNAEAVADHLGEVIWMRNYVAEQVEMVNEKTGELEPTVRFTILDTENNAYTAVSTQLNAAMRRIFSIFGDCSEWKAPVPIVVTRERSTRNAAHYYFSVRIVQGKELENLGK